MQRQAQADDCAVAGRQQQAVAAKIVEADPLAPDRVEQRPEAAFAQQLARQQVVALQAGIVIRPIVAVDRAKRQAAARLDRAGAQVFAQPGRSTCSHRPCGTISSASPAGPVNAVSPSQLR